MAMAEEDSESNFLYSFLFSSSQPQSQSQKSLLIRGGLLFIIVVLFQYFIARAPTVQKETKRRCQHAITGHALVQISYLLPKSISILLLSVGCIVMYLMKTYYFKTFITSFGPLLRPKELSGEIMPGAFYFLVGTLITITTIYDIHIVRYSIECLALADPMASWIGSSISSPKIIVTKSSSSSLSGCIACFMTSWIIGYWMLFLNNNNNNNDNNNNENSGSNSNSSSSSSKPFTITTLFIGATVCTIAEGLPFGNDNLNIPVLTAFVVEYFGR
jgi:dolichol kinase